MPIYEYRCQACDHEFEEWQKISENPIRTCPRCRKRRVERLVSRAAFHLKGGGWYRDGYGSSRGASDSSSSTSSTTETGVKKRSPSRGADATSSSKTA
jgi:putative FmdB family regulatory protein